MRKKLFAVCAAAAMASVGSAASASSITTFGTLAGATFAGTGIPNDRVEIDTITDNTTTTTITLGLTATPRLTPGALADDGAGTYFASPGTSGGRALWNFDFYASVSGTSTSPYDFKLLYDFDPGNGTSSTTLGIWDLGTLTPSASPSPIQNSENSTFGFLATSLGPITAPVFTPFNPNVGGQYTFELEAFNAAGAQVGTSDIINVDVVPEPTSMLLLGTGLVGLFVARKRFSA